MSRWPHVRCLFRKEKLQEAHQLQLFKANQHLLLEWSVKQSSEMAEKGLPKTRAEAERLLVEHLDCKVRVVSTGLLSVFQYFCFQTDNQNWTLLFVQTEIDARAERIDSVRDFGLGLIRSSHSSKSEIQKALSQLEEAKSGLDQAWLNWNTTLEQARTLQVMI